ncbi:MAG: hypothetical protein UR89_C0008G0010 [Candidatus Roizmanbacteria bacterium GW2011_GWA2_35_8]|uniref:Uncharacterized protein n=1 Tax=Candidatus Roizmanbacteria bacterium GW2011_GWA2_35_8 TaxID=1618479 RepID=A0A0G0D118_9BACT|nr:MAG: hypothetical protein UR89_C0008G0010 [Candidatus Roizmanbacteria bacterium GW2011_GWA2_35_8]
MCFTIYSVDISNMIKLYLFSKKVHRFLVVIIAVIGLTMSLTGILLKYPFISEKLVYIDLITIRYIHNNLSPFFTIVFLLMMLTGIVMYIFPFTRNR